MKSTSVNSIQTLDAKTLKQALEQHSITLVDVRESAEFAGEHIAGAILMPLSKFDPRQLTPTTDTQLVLYCRSGHRSNMAAQKLVDAGFESVAQLQGGIGSWKEAGYPTVINQNAPISLIRQVQIVAGSLVFVGTLLGALVSPWFLLLSGFVGAGLAFAGVTDTCMLGMLLAKLPYNQRCSA